MTETDQIRRPNDNWTPKEWQEEVDMAALMLSVAQAINERENDRHSEGPDSLVSVCEAILKEGCRRGYHPTEQHIAALNHEAQENFDQQMFMMPKGGGPEQAATCARFSVEHVLRRASARRTTNKKFPSNKRSFELQFDLFTNLDDQKVCIRVDCQIKVSGKGALKTLSCSPKWLPAV